MGEAGFSSILQVNCQLMGRVIDVNATLAISNDEHTAKQNPASKHSKADIMPLFLDYSLSDDL